MACLKRKIDCVVGLKQLDKRRALCIEARMDTKIIDCEMVREQENVLDAAERLYRRMKKDGILG